MNKLKTWWHVFSKSITNFSYYGDILKAPISFSLKYLYILVYFVITIQAIIWSVQLAFLLPQLPGYLQNLESRMREVYPKDLIVTIQNGVLSTNAEEPLFIDIPELYESERIEHFITIDTEASVEAYLDYETFFLLTDREIVYPDSSYEEITTYEVMPIDTVEDKTIITRESYLGVVDEVSSIIPVLPKLAPIILITGTFIFPLFLSVIIVGSHLFLLLFLSVVTWVVAAILKLKISYMKAYQLGIHALTFPILIQMTLSIAGYSFPLVFISGFLLWTVLVLTNLQEVKVE